MNFEKASNIKEGIGIGRLPDAEPVNSIVIKHNGNPLVGVKVEYTAEVLKGLEKDNLSWDIINRILSWKLKDGDSLKFYFVLENYFKMEAGKSKRPEKVWLAKNRAQIKGMELKFEDQIYAF